MPKRNGPEYQRFRVDPNLKWTVIQSRDYITLQRPIDFSIVKIAVEKVSEKIGRVSIAEAGLAPHLHIEGDIEEMFREISYAIHQDLVGGVSDSDLINHNAGDLVLESCAAAHLLIDTAWHPSANKEPAYWWASQYKEANDAEGMD